MIQKKTALNENQGANQALILWGVFILIAFLINGTVLFTIIYLQRRSIIVIWLGDGLGKFLNALF